MKDEIEVRSLPESNVSCSNCNASCCRLEVMLITDTGVPEQFVEFDSWGGMRMARLDDGWCAALDRSSMRCSIYDKRPLICREYEMGGYECLSERMQG
ncbi:YkgJ family cysteine cluster protein [Alteromonas pelagimontana]|uniref:YkgJ family cysteine cluster protein n=2 Tax=Alteromonas pelagimontana TaxID=1858656 RepID=A0A6M4MI57_9ALTE|nr:YkgJ family cysteine cluster protein [Alteromonas pelagimontana]QJR82783.1 YkgJ family cysteine cluster protein [Alteromonas pelagimontana]